MEQKSDGTRLEARYVEQNVCYEENLELCEYQEEQRKRSINEQLAFEAGKNLKSLPREALGHEGPLKAYDEGLDEREMKARPHPSISPDPFVMEKIEQCRQQQQEAMREAVAIRKEGRGSGSSNLRSRNVEPQDTSCDRVIGSRDHFVIQADTANLCNCGA